MQSRRWSLIETFTNIGLGFIVSLISQITIFDFYGVKLALHDNVAITLWFTAVSIVRSYAIRRVFNRVRK